MHILALEDKYADPNIDKVTLRAFGSKGFGFVKHLLEDSDCEIDFNKMTLLKLISGVAMEMQRLCTDSTAVAGEKVLPTVWLWYFKDQTNAWAEYGNQDIEKAYIAYLTSQGEASLQFSTSEFKYEIDFLKMVQTNKNLGTERKVRRRPAPSPIPSESSGEAAHDYRHVPKHWNPMKDEHYCLVLLSPTAQEYKDIATLMKDTGMRIRKVTRVQNPFRWEMYQNKKCHFLKTDFKDDPSKLNERYLFHGTSIANIQSICEKNFNWRLHGTAHGTAFGKGVYFATDPNLSMKYAKGENCMFVAQVLIGLYIEGDSSMTLPPSGYHSTSGPDMIIKYYDDEFYPAYGNLAYVSDIREKLRYDFEGIFEGRHPVNHVDILHESMPTLRRQRTCRNMRSLQCSQLRQALGRAMRNSRPGAVLLVEMLSAGLSRPQAALPLNIWTDAQDIWTKYALHEELVHENMFMYRLLDIRFTTPEIFGKNQAVERFPNLTSGWFGAPEVKLFQKLTYAANEATGIFQSGESATKFVEREAGGAESPTPNAAAGERMQVVRQGKRKTGKSVLSIGSVLKL
ncbi:unnamed protein product [Darwinula stevensoni]|uniref:Poly [ADP-ribose] polymerase n=1 Tax=Darwinula stevensoni TaxID=69355 RepID=A0A7R8X5T5_9CRUS|nr:unnamed protein product [Darwinula stevensoni]CAG0880756.1 unnamed protein product [Darwinula stevensoni]